MWLATIIGVPVAVVIGVIVLMRSRRKKPRAFVGDRSQSVY